jgi:hypothetical protein
MEKDVAPTETNNKDATLTETDNSTDGFEGHQAFIPRHLTFSNVANRPNSSDFYSALHNSNITLSNFFQTSQNMVQDLIGRKHVFWVKILS